MSAAAPPPPAPRPAPIARLGRRLRLLLALCATPWCALAQQAAAGAPEALRYLYSESMPAPQLIRSGGASGRDDGLQIRWARALAQELGRPLELLPRPRQRLERALLSGEGDFVCHAQPQWFGEEARQRVQWLRQPYQHFEQRLVVAPGQSLPRSLADIAGRTVGVVAGYRYPHLDELLGDERVRRSHAPREPALMQMLARGRVELAVVDVGNLAYQQKLDPGLRALRLSTVVVERGDLHCALAPAGLARLTLADFEQAQTRLLQRGIWQQLEQQYR